MNDVVGAAVARSATGDRSRATALAIIVLVFTVHSIDRGVVAVVLEPARLAFGLSDAQAGILGGLAYGAAYAASCIPIGLLVDRVSRRNLLGALLSIWSSMTLLSGFAQSFAALVACRAAVGAAEAGGGPASMSLISDLYGPKERARAFGVLYLGSGLGAAGAAIVGGWVAREFGWRHALIAAGVPGLLIALALFLLVGEPARGASEGVRAARPPKLREAFGFFARQHSLLWLYLGVPMVGGAMSVLATWTMPFLMRQHGLDIAQAGLALGLLLGPGLGLGAVVTGHLADLFGRTPGRRIVFGLVCLTLVLPALLLGYGTRSLVVCLAALALAQVLLASFLAPIVGLVTNLTRPNLRGAAISTRDVLANFVGFGVGPFVAGLASSAIGGPGALRAAILITSLGGVAVGILALAMAGRTLARDLARAAAPEA